MNRGVSFHNGSSIFSNAPVIDILDCQVTVSPDSFGQILDGKIVVSGRIKKSRIVAPEDYGIVESTFFGSDEPTRIGCISIDYELPEEP